MHKRKEEQTIEHFSTELKLKAMSCEYGELEESIIRDQLVLNVGDQGLQERLISIPDLKLDKAILLINQVKKTKEQKNFLKKKNNYSKSSWHGKTSENQALRSETNNSCKLYNCRKCGTEHEQFKCPAFGLKCKVCGRKNHFAVGCFNKTKYRKVQMANQSEDSETDEESGIHHLMGINEVSKDHIVEKDDEQNTWKEAISINGRDVEFKLDAGFQVNLIPLMKPLGQIELNCLVKGKMLNAEFLIVDKRVSPILGLKSCNSFGLVKTENISEIQKLNKKDEEKDKFVKKIKIIEKVAEPKKWSSNLVIVQKPDKTLRLCLDPKELNKVIKRDYLLIPTFSDIRSKLVNKRFFTILDIKKGFWHIKLDNKFTDLCTFSTPVGYYKFLRLPFGLSCAPEAFIKQSNECFSGINNVINYFDDYCIATETKEEHDIVLNQIVTRAKNLNIKFNLDKLQYCKKSVKFMGHVISELGLQTDPDQVKAILELKEPKNKTELERIIGMFNYLRDFIPKMAERISPLRELLKSNVLWEWSERHRCAFEELKQTIVNPPVLAHVDDKKDIVLQCDASKDGIGFCLLQDKKPIAFASRSLTETEIRCAQIEKEFLSIIFACRKFNYLIYGRPITVLTYHKPLVAIMDKHINKIPSNRLQKMRIKLLDYSITLKYLPGKYIHIADLLSRNFSNEVISKSEFDTVGTVHFINRYNENNTVYDLRKATEQDPVLRNIIEYFKNGWPAINTINDDSRLYFNQRNEIIVEKGVVYIQHKIIIPYKARPTILKLFHESHMGIVKSKNRAKNIFYWPRMLNDIEQHIKSLTSSPEYAQSNGLAENAVHIAKQILNKCLRDQNEIEIALLEYRCTPVGNLGVTPNLKPRVQDIKDKQIKIQEGYKAWYDKKANRKEIELIKGQTVMVKKKYGWVPGVVVKKAETPRSYIIKQGNGRIITRNLYHLRPSRNKFVQHSCNMAYYWDDSTNNVTEGIGETQNAENERDQEVRAQINQKIEIRKEINQKENDKGQNYTRSGRSVKPPKRYSP
ncbi:Uncharacterized protein FWK35_00029599, partial [Aphis craccivora]